MAKTEDFKFIRGVCCSGAPADICFYTDVDYWSVENFLYEFDYLANYVNPSKIRIHINSVGGSVVEGMSVFAKIQDCQIPTECINDALAASMGSIIWAAGDEVYMKDYALLMIHNPFIDKNGDKAYNQATDAFTQQLKTIYVKRFGLAEEEVEKIMKGNEGEDGTFITAAQAVEKGFLKPDHIIETPKLVKDSIEMAIKDSKDIESLKAVYNKLTSSATITNYAFTDTNDKTNSYKMEDTKINVFAALLGLTGESVTTEYITAKVNEIKAKADKYDKTVEQLNAEIEKNAQSSVLLDKLKAELTGAQTSVKNLQEDLDKTKAMLKDYKDAEAKAHEEKVKALIDQAVADCKINKDEREVYEKMAKADFELAESVLAKIPARDNLGNIISSANKQTVKENMKSEEEKIMAKVDEVVGKDFKFRTLA